MANNVAASMKASIIIDKKEIISSALSAYAEAQKEIAGNKIELLVDVSDDKARERLKEISKELAGKDYVIKFKNQGIEETMKSLDELFGRIKDIINLSNGLGTTSSPIIDVKDSAVQIDKLQNKLDELSKKYDELSKKKIGSSISGKDIDLVDNEEFKRLSKEFAVLKQELSDVKIHMELFEQSAMSYDSFIPYENKISELSGRIEKLTDDYRELAIVQKNMENNKPISLRNDVASAQDKITDQIVENEERKQKAYKATTDAVMYHAGVVSKLNKAETNGRFYGSNRGTGYFGTGHYFVDSATKHELDNNSSYSKLPYTSIDISQYDNLFKATTNELASGLHNFLENLTRFTQGSDSNTVSELFSQFQKVFGETVMDMQEFDATLEKLKVFMQNSSMDDRSDSVSTQFMKSLGYGGVDTRGTRYADTRYGTVIYDLKEESILQSNITDELQKQGQMLEKINYKKGQVFDQKEDTRIQGILDQQARAKEINAEFDKLFDSTKIKQLESELDSVNNTLKKNEEIIADCQKGISNADAEARKFAKEMKSFGLDVPESEIAEQADRYRSGYQERIDGLQKEHPLLEARRQELEENLEAEYKLANAAKERAKAIVEERYTPIKDTFQGDKIEQATTSAKELDKTLEQAVDVSTDDFDEILSKLDLTKSKLGEIVKITKQGHAGEDGKFIESFVLKDKNGSSETYGTSSNTEKGQLLRYNYIEKNTEAINKQKNVEKEHQAQKDAFHKKNLNAIDMEIKKREEESSAYAKTLKSQMEERYSAISSMEKSLDNYNSKLEKFSVKPADGHRYPVYQQQIDNLTKKISELDTLKNNLSKKDIIDESDMKSVNALQQEIDELILKMNNMSAGERGFDPLGADKALEKINSELKKNSAMSKEAKRQIQGFYDEIRSGNPSKPIKDLLDDMYKLIQAERLAGREGKSFMDIFKEKVVYGAAANMAGMIGIYDIINVGREGITVIRELDTALTEMRKVSDESISTLKEFQGISFDLADGVGTTAKQIQNSTADFMRLGYSLKEASELSQDANIYANVGDMEIDEATEHMISSIKAWSSEFNSEVEASSAIIDKYNEVNFLPLCA